MINDVISNESPSPRQKYSNTGAKIKLVLALCNDISFMALKFGLLVVLMAQTFVINK